MALALRIRVTWQGDVIEDGAHQTSQVTVPGNPTKIVRFRRPWTTALRLLNWTIVSAIAVHLAARLVFAVANDYRLAHAVGFGCFAVASLAVLVFVAAMIVRGALGMARPGGY